MSHIHQDTATYSAGLSLDLPIDRLAERNSYRRTLISLERQQRSFIALRDQITSNVRDALRAIRSATIRGLRSSPRSRRARAAISGAPA